MKNRTLVLWRPFSLERSVSWRDEKNIFFYILRYFDFYVFLLSTNLVSCLFFHFLAINHFFISTFLFRPSTQIWYFGLFPFAWNQDVIICCCNSSFLNLDTLFLLFSGNLVFCPVFIISNWSQNELFERAQSWICVSVIKEIHDTRFRIE